jgi:hypothetical protein
VANNHGIMDLTLHGRGQGFESPRLHLKGCGSRVKHEGKVEATELNRGFVLQPIGQRVFHDASRAVKRGECSTSGSPSPTSSSS